MPNTPTGRLRCMDVDDAVVSRILHANIQIASTIGNIFSYSKPCFSSRPEWGQINVHRTLLHDWFEASGGFCVRQTTVTRQLTAFCAATKIDCTAKEAEAAVYRLRAMMSQMRDTKKGNRQPPKRFASLQSLFRLISTDQPPSSSANDDDDDELAIMPAFEAPVETVSISDTDGDDEVHLDRLFPKASCSASPNYAEMRGMVRNTPGPTSRQYRAAKGRRKTKAPATLTKPCRRLRRKTTVPAAPATLDTFKPKPKRRTKKKFNKKKAQADSAASSSGKHQIVPGPPERPVHSRTSSSLHIASGNSYGNFVIKGHIGAATYNPRKGVDGNQRSGGSKMWDQGTGRKRQIISLSESRSIHHQSIMRHAAKLCKAGSLLTKNAVEAFISKSILERV